MPLRESDGKLIFLVSSKNGYAKQSDNRKDTSHDARHIASALQLYDELPTNSIDSRCFNDALPFLTLLCGLSKLLSLCQFHERAYTFGNCRLK